MAALFKKSAWGCMLTISVVLAAPVLAQDPIHAHRRDRPRLVVVPPTPEARLPIRVESLDVRTTIVGSVARTRIETVLYNPNQRVLEGELQFPLAHGQTVTGFALDMAGQLRPAVAVPKAKGRQVFEDVTRQQVDPAILEATRGNAYKLRVYPLPARGTRRVVLELTETLQVDSPLLAGAPRAHYRLPLQFAEKIGKLAIEVKAEGRGRGVLAILGSRALQADASEPEVIRYQASRFEGAEALEVRLGLGSPQFTSTQEFRGKTYAYAEVRMPNEHAARPAPRMLGLVWDASGSRAKADHAKEFALLDAYFKRVGNVEVQLKVVRDVAEPVRRFAVRAGDWRALKEHLAATVYDGATHAAAMSAPPGSDLVLLVSDGLGNYGAPESPSALAPVMAITSSVISDPIALRRQAESSGGELIDLSRQDTGAALELLTRRRARLVELEGQGVRDLVAGSHYGQDGWLRFAGVLQQPEGTVRAVFEGPDGRRTFKPLTLTFKAEGTQSAALGVAAHQWAALKATELAADEVGHGAELERLGMYFGLVTPRTSLIVLDAAADYARFGIEPPDSVPELVAEVERLMAQRSEREQGARQKQLSRVALEFVELVQWWERDYPKGEEPSPPEQELEDEQRASMPRGAERRAMAAPSLSGVARTPPPIMAAAPAPVLESGAQAGAPQVAEAGAVVIALRKWEPDSPYARRMRAAAPQDAYAIYLDERPGYENSTAFFLDAADILGEKQQAELAARVISNLAEMNLEDRHILRILAYRLQQMGQTALALPLLDRVLALAPDEPQSWRDLALAQAEAGLTQKAVDALWHVVAQPWHNRFPGIEMVALIELNAIVAKARSLGEMVDTGAVPQELQKNLPTGLRTVLAWDADNTDIDLWITDPNGERADYSNRLTYQGGLMSRDFTGGYGPEVFLLRAPKPGKYKIQAQFYGHRQQIVAPATTLMLRFTTGFGTQGEQSKQFVVRLSGTNEVLELGEFQVGPTAATGPSTPAHHD